MQTTLSITEARKKIFSIAHDAYQRMSYYTLTEHGRPKVVVVSAKKFHDLLAPAEKDLYASSMKHASSRTSDRGRQPYIATPFFRGFGSTHIFPDTARDGVSYEELERQHNEKELVKAQLYIDLLEKYKYPLESVQLGQYVRVGGAQSRRYIESDIIIDDQEHDRAVLFLTDAKNVDDEQRTRVLRDLFDLAKALSFTGSKDIILVYFTRMQKNKVYREKMYAINYTEYKTYRQWERAGKPHQKKIPSYATHTQEK